MDVGPQEASFERLAAGLGLRAGSGGARIRKLGGGAELFEQPLHVFAEAVMLDLESVPGRVLPLEAMPDIGGGACLERLEP